ncbi:hypothetical protein NDU88_003125, partial [Pleurodeles waltl]
GQTRVRRVISRRQAAILEMAIYSLLDHNQETETRNCSNGSKSRSRTGAVVLTV